MDYLYSVIIPVYNAEKTIHRCLDSLLGQAENRAELILINDGSTDQSGQICQEYALQYPCVVLIDQTNLGASAARNAGLEIARGKYILFVDSDDYVMPGYFDAFDFRDEDFIVFSYITMRAEHPAFFSLPEDLLASHSHTDRILHVLMHRIAGPCNKRFVRAIIQENNLRFKEDLIIGEDFIFGLEYMLLCATSCALNQHLYCVDETSPLSVTRSAKYNPTQFLLIYEYAFPICRNCRWDSKSKHRLIQRLDYLYCRTAFSTAEHCMTGLYDSLKDVCCLLSAYCSLYQKTISPINLCHWVMRMCVKFRLTPIIIFIAFLYKHLP